MHNNNTYIRIPYTHITYMYVLNNAYTLYMYTYVCCKKNPKKQKRIVSGQASAVSEELLGTTISISISYYY